MYTSTDGFTVSSCYAASCYAKFKWWCNAPPFNEMTANFAVQDSNQSTSISLSFCFTHISGGQIIIQNRFLGPEFFRWEQVSLYTPAYSRSSMSEKTRVRHIADTRCFLICTRYCPQTAQLAAHNLNSTRTPPPPGLPFPEHPVQCPCSPLDIYTYPKCVNGLSSSAELGSVFNFTSIWEHNVPCQDGMETEYLYVCLCEYFIFVLDSFILHKM